MSKPKKHENNVFILLATYNGAEYLAEQLRSIQAQTNQQWHILIRDDGSSDQTLNIIHEFVQADARIELSSDSLGHLGVAQNFGHLMTVALKRNARYIAFCDQDDVWEPGKLHEQLVTLCELEDTSSLLCPTLVFSDLILADNRLTRIGDSYMHHQGIIDSGSVKLENLLYQNIVVGNTILMNSTLLKLATPLPEGIHMHDWWTVLCAAACGEIKYIPEQLVTYRLHDANQVGAPGIKTAFNPFRKRWWIILVKMNKLFISSFLQIAYLRGILHSELDLNESERSEKLERNLSLVEYYLNFLSGNFPGRLWRMTKGSVKSKIPLLNTLFGIQLLLPGLIKNARKAVHDVDDVLGKKAQD